MILLLKKTRAFGIYDIIITIFLSSSYFAKENSNSLLLWVFCIAYPIIIFHAFIAGPLFAIIIQKNKLTSKESLWSVLLIFTMTFITISIPSIIFNRWDEFFKKQFILPLSIALFVSMTYWITSIIYKKIKSVAK